MSTLTYVFKSKEFVAAIGSYWSREVSEVFLEKRGLKRIGVLLRGRSPDGQVCWSLSTPNFVSLRYLKQTR